MERNLLASAICALLIVNSVSSINYAVKKVCNFPDKVDCGSGSIVGDSGTSSSTTHEVRRPMGGMTLGQVMTIRRERDVSTSQINANQQGTGNNRQKNRFPEIPAGLEDALDYDSYITEAALTPQQKQNILNRFNQQQPDRNIPQPQFTTVSALSQLLRSYGNRDPNNDPTGTLQSTLNDLLHPSWLPLVMPNQFSYTAAALLNSDTQGLHHSFIRHKTEWEQVISFNQALMNRLSPVMAEITALEAVSANTAQVARQQTEIARDALRNRLRQLSDAVYYDVKTAFVEIQTLLHQFIQQNLTNASFSRSTVNNSGQVRLEFRVRTLTGANRTMVICVSDKLYQPWFNPPLHSDRRPIRTVITVFFR